MRMILHTNYADTYIGEVTLRIYVLGLHFMQIHIDNSYFILYTWYAELMVYNTKSAEIIGFKITSTLKLDTFRVIAKSKIPYRFRSRKLH